MDYISNYTGQEIDDLLSKSKQVHTAAAEAEAAKDAAEAANSQAQSASTTAQAAKASSEAAAATANTAKDSAQAAKTAAESANTQAQSAKTAAQTAQAGAEESENYVRGTYETVMHNIIEAPTRYSNSLTSKASGEVINIPTAESRLLSLKMLGNTAITPANPANPISPDNPATIASVGGVVNVMCSGKNLVRHSAGTLPETSAGMTLLYDGATGIYTLNGTQTAGMSRQFNIISALYNTIKVPAGKKLTLSIIRVDGTATTTAPSGTLFDLFVSTTGGGNVSLLQADTGVKSKTIAFSSPLISRAWIYVPNIETYSRVFTNFRFRLQVEISDNYTGWEIPTPSVNALPTPIPLKDTDGNPIELRGIPATYNADGSVATWAARDEIFRDTDGAWKLSANVYSWVIPQGAGIYESSTLIFADNSLSLFLNNLPVLRRVDTNSKVEVACNTLQPISETSMTSKRTAATAGGSFVSAGDNHHLLIIVPPEYYGWESGDTTTTATGKARVAFGTNPITVHYILNTPTIPLHPDTIAALERLYPTYPGRTVIMGTDAVSPGWEVEYVEDINYYAQTQADMAGTLATRPTVGARIGQQYFATDQVPKRVYAWDGAEWLQTL